MEWVVVERAFPEPLTPEAVRNMADGAGCLDLYRVRAVRSYLTPDRKRLLCIFQAPDAEAVRAALRMSSSASAAVWPATLHTP